MRHRKSPTIALFIAICMPFSHPALAQEELLDEDIHAALPLYTFDWQELWPRGYLSGDEFGCTSRVAFGDWRFTPRPENDRNETHWFRFTNYGVFHCAAIMRMADKRIDLDTVSSTPAFFVRLGIARQGGATWELWAIQKGTVPGSQYTLLARPPGNGIIEHFTVLQQRCPREMRREKKGLGGWVTRYCEINSHAQLLSLSRRMLLLPKIGIIEKINKGN